jgi:hypothetical protein
MKSLLFCLALGLTFAACEPAADQGTKTEAATPAATTPATEASATPEATAAAYYCPMKCEGEKTYPAAGKCPKCKMDLTTTN